MNKKITVLIVLTCTMVVGIGVSLAYFVANNNDDGNETNLNITTEQLGSILWTGTRIFTSYDLLPGQIGIQEFTIEKNSDNGIGIYEIDLAGVLPEEFRSDIEISLYKTTEPETNNVTVNVADPTLENETLYQEDSLNITGTPELVYQGTLTNNSQIILEQADFDVTTLKKTTYYLVYHYKNNGNQDDQQGKSFSGTISVRLIENKTSNNTAVSYITALAANSNELINDESADHNIRYVGSNPNNYVLFNDELWRIIGVMNNIDDGNGNLESRLKLIRNESIGEYSWDYNSDGTYDNDWTTSTLMELLNNGAYYNRTSGNYYNGDTNSILVDFSSNGLTEQAKSLIAPAKWNLSGVSEEAESIPVFYSLERATSITWTGEIGLMYPSDYGYATTGGNSTDRAGCLNLSFED